MQRQDIQGLRGVAVLLVVLYHAGLPMLPGGYVGVDVFFVISGYLITGLLMREVADQGRIDYLLFLGRRARRLLPAALVLVTFVVGASIVVYPPVEREGILSAARAAVVYASNLWFAGRAVDYLGGDAASNPLLHMWSLAVEEQFYLLWPWLIVFAAAGLSANAAQGRALRLVIVVSGVSFVACVWMTWVAQPWGFFGTPFRAWEFGLGAIVFLLGQSSRQPVAVYRQLVGSCGAVAVLLSAMLLDDAALFPGIWALAPAGGTALVLMALAGNTPSRLKTLLSGRLIVRAGDVSYSWYLWHWPLLVMAPVLLPESGFAEMVAVVLLSYLAAELSFRFVEEPFRRHLASRASAKSMVAVAAAATFTTALALTALKYDAAGEQLGSNQRLINAARSDLPAVYTKGCHASITEERATECTAGAAHSQRVVVLLGDSHAAHWYPALELLALKNEWRLVSITKSACPSVAAPVILETHRRDYRECATWRLNAMRRISELKPIAVVLGSSSRYKSVSTAQWESATRRTIAALEVIGAVSVVVRDTPWPGNDVPVCLARADHRGLPLAEACNFERKASVASGEMVFQAERRAVASSKRAMLVDMTPHICPDERCVVASGGVIRFSDGNHLTASYSRQLAPNLEVALRAGVLPWH